VGVSVPWFECGFIVKENNPIRRNLNFEFSKISKPKKIQIPRSKPVSKPRAKSKFIDNSAIEEDDDGGDIASRATTPETEKEIIDLISPSKIWRPKYCQPVQCPDCGKFVSGPKILPVHQKSKKCKNRSKGWKQFSCRNCPARFNNRHDCLRHRESCIRKLKH